MPTGSKVYLTRACKHMTRDHRGTATEHGVTIQWLATFIRFFGCILPINTYPHTFEYPLYSVVQHVRHCARHVWRRVCRRIQLHSQRKKGYLHAKHRRCHITLRERCRAHCRGPHQRRFSVPTAPGLLQSSDPPRCAPIRLGRPLIQFNSIQ